MIRKPLIHLGLAMCAFAIASDLAGFVDFGNLVYAFAAVMLMFTVSLTLAIAVEKKDQADG